MQICKIGERQLEKALKLIQDIFEECDREDYEEPGIQSFYHFIQKENMDETEKLVKNVIKGIQDKKGSGIVVADLSHIDGTICKYFVICQGNSPQQVEAIAGSVGDHVREVTGEKPVNCIGLGNAVWVAMDYVDVLVHIFVPETRQYYDLEHLWEDARLEKVPDII